MTMRIFFILAIFSFAVGAVFAESSDVSGSADKQVQRPKPKAIKDMTAADLADATASVLDHSIGVVDVVQGLKKKTGSDGRNVYEYNGIPIARLQREVLVALYNRVRQERTRLNTERLVKQMESMQNAQKAANAAVAASRIPSVAAPVVMPPSPPPAVQRVVEPPKAPPTPPQASRR